MKLKKLCERLPLPLLLSFALLFGSVSAAPAGDKSDYVPTIPEFVNVAGSSVIINTKYDKESATAKSFFSDFYKNPYLILVSQETWNDYIPAVKPGAGATIKQEYVGEDKRWSLIFVKIKSGSFHFSVHDPDDSAMAAIRSQPVSLYSQIGEFEALAYAYDYAGKRFSAPRHSSSSNAGLLSYLSYVVGSSPVSALTYSYNRQIGKLYSDDRKTSTDFEIVNAASTVPDMPLYYYNWWIGKKDVVPDFPPDNPSSGDSSGETSSEPEEPPSTEHSLTIYYRFKDGSVAAPTYTGTYEEGAQYNIPHPVVTGYPRQFPIVSVNGTMGHSDIYKTVYYFTSYYDEDGSTDGPWSAYFYFFYSDGRQAFPMKTIPLTGGNEMSTYDAPKIPGYQVNVSGLQFQNSIRNNIYHTFIYFPDSGSSSGSGGSSSGGGTSSGGTSSGGGGSSGECPCPCPCPDCSGSSSGSGSTSSGGGSSSGGSSSGGSGGSSSEGGGGSSGGESPGDSSGGSGDPGASGFDFPIFDPNDYTHTPLPMDPYDPSDEFYTASYPLFDFGGFGTASSGGIGWDPSANGGLEWAPSNGGFTYWDP